MKIDINKDFEEAFPNEIYSGFTLGQCLAAAIGLAMYFFGGENHMPALIVIAVGMAFKVIEFIMRLL